MNQPQNMLVFDRQLLRQRRDRAAGNFAEFDFLFRDVAGRLLDRLDLVKRDFSIVLDLGSYNGAMAAMLKKRKGVDIVIASDLSYAMASSSHTAAVVADEEFLPFRGASLDAVISNMSLQWVNDLPGTLAQIRQSLKADGLFLAALPGAGTLPELRQSLMEAELSVTGGASPRVSPFVDLRDMAGLLQRAGFALPVVDSDRVTVDYSSPLKLMHDLRGMAAGNAALARTRMPTRRAVIMEAARIYQKKFGTADGRVPATFEIVYAIGWKPHASQQKPLQPGTAKLRLADALQTEEKPAGEKVSS
jgi:SAM-dependent methyltransferase